MTRVRWAIRNWVLGGPESVLSWKWKVVSKVDGPFSLRTVHFHLETHVCVTFVSLKRKNMESWNELIESVFRAKSSYPAQLTESIITISVINPFQARFLFQNLKSDPALTLQHPTLPCYYYFDLFSKLSRRSNIITYFESTFPRSFTFKAVYFSDRPISKMTVLHPYISNSFD